MEDTKLLESSKNEIVQEFRTVIDFYRMEYSEELLPLFQDFGYLLICKLFFRGYFSRQMRRGADGAEIWPEIDYWNYDPIDEAGYGLRYENRENTEAEELIHRFQSSIRGIRGLEIFASYNIHIAKTSVLRPLLQVSQRLTDLWKQTVGDDRDANLVYDTVCRIHELCTKGSAEKNRYILPKEIVEQLAGVIQDQRKQEHLEPVRSVFDPQYASGEMLLAACDYLEKAQGRPGRITLQGFENHEGLRMAAQILCALSGREIRRAGEDFLQEMPVERFDLVLANPPFSSENLPYSAAYKAAEQPEIRHLRGKFNIFVVKSLLALTENGSAAIVVPDSYLFSSRRETVDVRDWIQERLSADQLQEDGSIASEATAVFLYTSAGESGSSRLWYHPGLQRFFDGNPFLLLSTLLAAYRNGVIRDVHFIYENGKEKGLYGLEAFSDGELMWIARTGLILMAQNYCGDNMLFLYDEPDVHFNDDWNKDFIKILYEMSAGAHHEFLIATHSTLLLTDALYEQIHLFDHTSGQKTEVRHIDISTFAAQRDEISRVIFGASAIGTYASDSVRRMLQETDYEKMIENIEKLGPGYQRFRLYERFYARFDEHQD